MAVEILVVDDEADIRDLVCGILEDDGYTTRSASDSDSAMAAIEARLPSLLVLDVWLQGSKLDGLELLELVKSRHRDLPVVIISGHGNVETAVAAIKKGAYDFIEKPFEADHLVLTIERATEADKLRRENAELKRKNHLNYDLHGRSTQINLVRQSIEKVAATNSRVMISGASGVGKEVAARMIHDKSLRSDGGFYVIAAASMEPQRMEQELFGIEQNGGVVKTGLFERAHGGTLFIDELADMPLPTQAKILRVLTDQSFERVGGISRVEVDVRVISATSKDLAAEIAEGRFREDLFHRLNVVPLAIPSLDQRREDIPLLANYFLEMIADATGRSHMILKDDAIAALQAYNWPGNVRQIKNVMERLVIMSEEGGNNQIYASDLPSEITNRTDMATTETSSLMMSASLREAREAFEREYLKTQVNRFSGNISKTASFIGMERSALHRKLKALGVTNSSRNDEGEAV